MISPFGVDHGISKAYAKVAGKLVRQGPKVGDTMNQRLRVNYSQWRNEAGQAAHGVRAFNKRPGNAHFESLSNDLKTNARGRKVAAQSQLAGIANINRKKRVLP